MCEKKYKIVDNKKKKKKLHPEYNVSGCKVETA